MSDVEKEQDVYTRLSNERKQLQKEGLVPKWYTTGGYQLFKSKYEYDTNGRSVRGQFERIAKTAAKHLEGTPLHEGAEQKFFDLFWKGWVSLSTPVLANMGTTRALPVSCSGGVVEDSIHGFYQNRLETAVLTKHGFGTSAYLGNIRHRGAAISTGGKANGVVPVFKGHVQDMREVSQGSSRRGAWAGYIEIDHPDFDELVDHIMAEPDDCNIGWNVSDEFISRLDSGDPEAVRRFQRAMKMKMVTGRGYFLFVDKANRQAPQIYKDKGLTIKASNLCVTPETKILTRDGYVEIQSVAGRKVDVWNGNEWSAAEVIKTGVNQKIIRVVTNSGSELECTEYHKFYVQNGYHKPATEVRANELKVGDKLINFDLPDIAGTEEFENAYDNGFFSADGCEFEGKQIVYLYGEKDKLRGRFASITNWRLDQNNKRTVGYSKTLNLKYTVPTAKHTIKSRLEWLAGYADGDGCIVRVGDNESLQICSTHQEFLKSVRLMLQTMGVNSKVTRFVEERVQTMPDGKGGKAEYVCKPAWRLLVSSSGLHKLRLLGFKTDRLVFEGKKPQRNAEQFITVTEVVDDGRVSDTYCFSEPKRHMGMFEGILTGQCNEVMLHSDSDLIFTCILASMNDARWDEWKDTDAPYWATVFLDCVASEFIERAKEIEGLEKAVRFTEKSRALGLGQCGLHTLFQSKMIPFESFEAHMLSQAIVTRIHAEATRATKDMAKVLGEPEWCKGYGVRNTHLIALAPTKSTALLMGGISEGINPDPAMVFTQKSAGGDVDRVNPTLLSIMKKKGVYTKKVLRDLMDHFGSVQHVDWLTDEEKAVFKTAFEINQMAVLRMASARQRFIDQGQSLNLFFSAEEKPEWIAEVHAAAFHDPYIKGLYYVYTQAGVKAAQENVCEACQ